MMQITLFWPFPLLGFQIMAVLLAGLIIYWVIKFIVSIATGA